MSYKHNIKNTLIITLICIFAISLFSTSALGQDTVIVDNRADEDVDTDSIQEALQMVSDGGTIIINERTDNTVPYEGAIIGKETMDTSKSVTIEGKGVVSVKAAAGQESAIVIDKNGNRVVTIKGIMFVGATHAIEARSNSEIKLQDNAIGSTITDEPFVLNDNIGDESETGAYIEDSGTYFQDSEIFREDIVLGRGGSINFEPVGVNPGGLIYEQKKSPLDYNPVTQSNYEGVIQVGSPTESLSEEDDSNIETPFYSLQEAVRAASSDSVIEVYPRSDGSSYDITTFEGVGVSGVYDVTIEGKTSGGSELPVIKGFRADYPGNYNIRNVQISEDVISRENNANIDVSNNYWQSPSGPSSERTNVVERLSSTIIDEPYCTDVRCEEELDFNDLNDCIKITTPAESVEYGCNGASGSIDINIQDFEYSDRLSIFDGNSQEFRQADFTVEKSVAKDANVKIDVVQSDIQTDGEKSLDSYTESKSGKIDSQFSTIINSLDEGEVLPVTLRGEIKVNDNQPIVVNLGSVTLEGTSDNSDVRLPGYIGETRSSISVDDFRGVIRDTETRVSRFNADNEDASFQDPLIPPARISGGETTDGSAGTVDYFYELRSNPDRAAVINPQKSPDNLLRVGMSIQGIPEADSHVLNVTYALQGEDKLSNSVDINIVNRQNEEIYSARGSDTSRLDVTSTGSEPYNNAASTEDLETKTVEIPLHSTEIDFVNENGQLYVVFEKEGISEDATLLLYDVSVESSDNKELVPDEEGEDDDESESDDGGESVSTNLDERPGSFTVSFNVDGSTNPDYDTYDVEPNENIDTTIFLENTGDTTIEGEFVVTDTYEVPNLRYPDTGVVEGDATTETEIGTYSISVEGGGTESIPISLSWGPDEFGNHTIKFRELDDGELRPINEDLGQTPQFDTYVLQPVTAEIQEVITPDSHMSYDNFNSEIRIKNVGDLEGERTVYASFGDWQAEKTVFMGGGDSREGTKSEEAVVRFARDVHRDTEYPFTRREYTTPGDIVNSDTNENIEVSGTKERFETEFTSYVGEPPHENYRPNAPFSMTEGEFQYQVSIENDVGGNPFPDVSNLLQDSERNNVEIYDAIINDLQVTVNSGDGSVQLSQEPEGDSGTIYASAFPYVRPSMGVKTSETIGETYVENASVSSGLHTMFGMPSSEDTLINRGATPLNHEPLDSVTQPSDRYFSIYYSHQNRYCNEDLLGGEENVQVPEDEASESDTNVFLPYSANSENPCTDTERFVSLQLPRFTGTTDMTTETDSNVVHPSGELNIKGVNQETFKDLDENNSIMFAVATVTNPNTGQPATARFEIVSDNELEGSTAVGLGEELNNHQVGFGDSSYDDNVVGVASVELRPRETKKVQVPIVIKNDEGNNGEHTLKIRPRSEEDYLKYAPDAPMSQFEVPINVETYGDTIVDKFEPVDNGKDSSNNDPILAQEADLRVNQVCRAVEPAGESRDEMVGTALGEGTTTPDIIFAVDESGSVYSEATQIQNAIEIFVSELGDNYNYAIESYHDGGTLRGKNLGEYDDADDFINTVQSTDLTSASTPGRSFSTSENQFENYGDPESKNYMIVLGDGDEFQSGYSNSDATVISIYFGSNYPGRMRGIANEDEDGNRLYFNTNDGSTSYNSAFQAIQTEVSGGYDVVEGLNPRSGLNEEDRGVVQHYGLCDPAKEGNNEIAEFEAQYTNYGGEEMEIRPEAIAEFEALDRHAILHKKNSHLTGDRFFAEYNQNDATEMEGKTWAKIEVDGTALSTGESFTIQPGETRNVTFERKFQEPGLYHVRVSPCRDISDSGPQHYNLEGFTGVPDTIDYPTGSDLIESTLDRYPTAVTGVNRVSTGSNIVTTPEMSNSLFHGSLGCTEKTSSVFVYDITQPVADFHVGHSENTVMDNDDEYTDVATQSVNPDDSESEFTVHEGGTLFLDGSSYDCPNCYDRPHFEPYDLETPRDSPDFPISNPGTTNDFRQVIQDGEFVFSYRMSTDNARIAGAGMMGEYPDGEDTHQNITEKGMQWQVDGNGPNYGQTSFCTEVNQDAVDEHCYMEQFGSNSGDGTKPDYYQVVPHRFTDTSGETVELTVWDDASLTEEEANSNTTTKNVNVVPDNTAPTVSIGHENFNDLSYDKENGFSTVWHREEDVFGNVDYRDNTPDNFASSSTYENTYEGTRTCLETTASDSEIGISQSAWWQTGSGDILDDGTRVIDDGSYVDRQNDGGVSTLGLHQVDVIRTETRDGERRCLIFEETGPDNDKDREQTFEYEVFDYANNVATDTTTVDIDTDTQAPNITTFSPEYDTSTGNNPDGSDVGWVWAHHSDTGFAGDDVQFESAATDGGVGVACLDVQLEVGTGPSYDDYGINDNCQSMGDQNGDGGDPAYTGSHGNSASNGAEANVGSSQTPGAHSTNNYFSSVELGDEYALPSNDPDSNDIFTISQEQLYAVDWYGNTDSSTIDIDVRVDGTSPSLGGSYSCSGKSCGTDEVTFESQGPDGGTPIVDAEVISVSDDFDDDDTEHCDITGDDSGSDCDATTASASVSSFDENAFDGEVSVDVSHSVEADASVDSATCESGDTSVDVDADASGEFTLKITDAHGNTQTKTYDWSIDDDDDDDDDAPDDCGEDEE